MQQELITVDVSKIKTLNDNIQNMELTNREILHECCRFIGDNDNASVILLGFNGVMMTEYIQPGMPTFFLPKQTTKETSNMLQEKKLIDNQLLEQLKNIYITQFNSPLSVLQLKGSSAQEVEKFISIVIPVNSGGKRIGTIVLYRPEMPFQMESKVYHEIVTMLVSVVLNTIQKKEENEEIVKVSIVKSALATLSYSELEAIIHVFNELEGNEGLLVASKIADRIGITRSVIVNALRKFESAGLIESRSLGMKGTYIKITNEYLLDELKKIPN